MDIVLEKPLIVFDIEATGDKITKDRIVEIATLISGAKITDESKKVASNLLKGS